MWSMTPAGRKAGAYTNAKDASSQQATSPIAFEAIVSEAVRGLLQLTATASLPN
jgi:hypothetical protein